jgi:hypothetical protein
MQHLIIIILMIINEIVTTNGKIAAIYQKLTNVSTRCLPCAKRPTHILLFVNSLGLIVFSSHVGRKEASKCLNTF